MSTTLSRLKREGGISLKTLQPKMASSNVEGRMSCFSRVVAGNLGSLSSYSGDFRDPLMLAQESQFSKQVVRSMAGFLSSRSRGLGPHLELRL